MLLWDWDSANETLILSFNFSFNSSYSSKFYKIDTSFESDIDLMFLFSSRSNFIDLLFSISAILKLKCFYLLFSSLFSSLKSLIVINEFSIESTFLLFLWLTYFFSFFLQMYPLQIFWIFTTLWIIYLISSRYFLVKYPLKFFCIIMTAFYIFLYSKLIYFWGGVGI